MKMNSLHLLSSISTLLKPSQPSSNQLVPLTIFDLAALNYHISVLRAFHPPMPTNAAIKTALVEALNLFPHLSGRFCSDPNLGPCIHLNGAGIRLIETRFSSHLSHWLVSPDQASTSLRPPTSAVSEELLHIQLNRFDCGGMVIGLAAHHRVADGPSVSLFLVTWAKLARGSEVGCPPCHDRSAIAAPREPPFCEFNHENIEFRKGLSLTKPINSSNSFLTFKVYFSPSFICTLKKMICRTIMKTEKSQPFTTFECLLTHVWKNITIARGLHNNQITRARISVNGRRGGRTKAPAEYFGNLVLWANTEFTAKDLIDECDPASVAQTIHEALATVDERYFQSFVDYGEIVRKKKSYGSILSSTVKVGGALSPDIEVDSWLGMPSTGGEIDFGGGKLCAVGPLEFKIEGLVVMMTSLEKEGGVDVYLSLHEHCASKFTKIAHCLKQRVQDQRSLL